jgi:hypothetical protein
MVKPYRRPHRLTRTQVFQIAGLLSQAGLVLRARLLREPNESTETTQQAYLPAHRPAWLLGHRLLAGSPSSALLIMAKLSVIFPARPRGISRKPTVSASAQ